MSEQQQEVTTRTEVVVKHMVIKNTWCPQYPACMPDLNDPSTWTHSPAIHRDMGLHEEERVVGYSHTNPIKNWLGNFKMKRKVARA